MIETLGIKKAHLIIAASVTSLVLGVTTILLLTKGNDKPEPTVTQVEKNLINEQLLKPEEDNKSGKNLNEEKTTSEKVVQPKVSGIPKKGTPAIGRPGALPVQQCNNAPPPPPPPPVSNYAPKPFIVTKGKGLKVNMGASEFNPKDALKVSLRHVESSSSQTDQTGQFGSSTPLASTVKGQSKGQSGQPTLERQSMPDLKHTKTTKLDITQDAGNDTPKLKHCPTTQLLQQNKGNICDELLGIAQDTVEMLEGKKNGGEVSGCDKNKISRQLRRVNSACADFNNLISGIPKSEDYKGQMDTRETWAKNTSQKLCHAIRTASNLLPEDQRKTINAELKDLESAFKENSVTSIPQAPPAPNLGLCQSNKPSNISGDGSQKSINSTNNDSMSAGGQDTSRVMPKKIERKDTIKIDATKITDRRIAMAQSDLSDLPSMDSELNVVQSDETNSESVKKDNDDKSKWAQKHENDTDKQKEDRNRKLKKKEDQQRNGLSAVLNSIRSFSTESLKKVKVKEDDAPEEQKDTAPEKKFHRGYTNFINVVSSSGAGDKTDSDDGSDSAFDEDSEFDSESQKGQPQLQVQGSNQNTPSTNKGPDKTMPAVAPPLPPRRRRSSLSDLSKLQKGEQPQLQVQESNQNASSTIPPPLPPRRNQLPGTPLPLPPRGNNPSKVSSLNRRRSSLSDVPKQPKTVLGLKAFFEQKSNPQNN